MSRLYKCIYCEDQYVETGVCPKCRALAETIKENPNAAFNVLSILIDEKGGELYIHNDKGHWDFWIY